jgi:PilZ domain
MTLTPPVVVERRVGQRFAFNLPVSLRDVSTAAEGLGFTQDLSSRGAFLFTVMALNQGAEVELTLKMPSEITLGESMRVRCRGRVLRIVNAADNGWKPASTVQTETKLAQYGSEKNKSAETKIGENKIAETTPGETKIGVAVCLNGYEYLPETEDGSADFRRISALHGASETERAATPAPASPRVAVH